MGNFVNREHELRILNDHLGRPGAGLFVLYGRRRIGKTALLQEVIRSRADAVYHVATRSTLTEELGRLSVTLAAAWNQPLLAAQPLTTVQALLAALQSAPPGVFVLDELPYLIETEPSLPTLLQAAWDHHLSRSELKLVVCGSSSPMMESTFLSPSGALYGRRTGQLRLGALEPAHLAAMLPWGSVELLEAAALFGGIPGYLARLQPELDLRGNLRRHVLQRGEPLHEEVPFLMREELRQPRIYNAILATIAAGARKFGEISSKTGLAKTNLTRYLGILSDLGLVEREVPITEASPDKSRKGIYRISDPFVGMWFALVHPNRDALERGLVEAIYDTRIVAVLDRLLPHAVEPVIRDMLHSGPWASRVPFVSAHAGRYWSPTAELDVVLLDATRRHAFVVEVKWTQRPVGPELLDHLRARVAREQAFAGLESVTLAVVSRAGFTSGRVARDDEQLIDVGSVGLE